MRHSTFATVIAALWLCTTSTVGTASADASPADTTAPLTETAAEPDLLASMQLQRGNIPLPGGFATIKLPERFVYLNSTDTARLLTEGWGNPDGSGTLGMILPADVHPLSVEGWGIVLTYDNDGYVSDDDASDIDYNDLLSEMKDSMGSENEARQQAGFGNIELVGWALPPSYDHNSHKMVWAKELKFDGNAANTLNYNIRVLGREGVLVLNAVAAMDQLQLIRTETPALVAATEFVDGKRYEDFNADTDRTAEYGLAALVAGGAAAKMGLFAKIGAFLLVFKKLIIAGFIGIGVWLFKRFRNKPAK